MWRLALEKEAESVPYQAWGKRSRPCLEGSDRYKEKQSAAEYQYSEASQSQGGDLNPLQEAPPLVNLARALLPEANIVAFTRLHEGLEIALNKGSLGENMECGPDLPPRLNATR